LIYVIVKQEGNLNSRHIVLSQERKGALFIVAASVLWSFGGVCIKLIPWDAMTIVGLRALFAAAVFAIYRRTIKINLTLGNILAGLCLSGTTMLFVYANKLTTAAAAILLQFSAPIFIILMHLIFYKKKPKLSEVIAVSVTVLGMILFFADKLEQGGLLGNILATGSGITFAGMVVSSKRADADPEQSIMLGFIINALIGVPFAVFNATADIGAWGLSIFLGVVHVGIAYIFFSAGIVNTPALLACLIAALEPVLNPILVAIFLGEIPGPFSVVGGIVIIATVVTYNVWLEKLAAASSRHIP
jgi:drug/metabolite transporter (DMT)-like permease